MKTYIKKKKELMYDVLCFSCNEKFNTYDKLNSHFESKNHNFYIDLNDLNMICMKCKLKSGLIILRDKLTSEQKKSIQQLIEKRPIPPTFLSKEEIVQADYTYPVSNDIIDKIKDDY